MEGIAYLVRISAGRSKNVVEVGGLNLGSGESSIESCLSIPSSIAASDVSRSDVGKGIQKAVNGIPKCSL